MNRLSSLRTLLSDALSASALASLGVVVLSGCTGTVSPPGSTASAGAPSSTPAGGGASGSGAGAAAGLSGGSAAGAGAGPTSTGRGGATAAVDCTAAHAAAVRLQLLAANQYDNTVQDLFKVTGDPGKNLGDKVFQGLDDTSVGQWASAAATVAQAAAASLSTWAPCTPPSTGSATACESQIISTVGTRAFRRKLTSDETAQMKTLFDAGIAAKDFTTGVTWFLTGLLQAPDFTYQIVRPDPSEMPAVVRPLASPELATRLAYFIWNSTPDDTLITAGANNELSDSTQLQAQISRMLQDSRASRGIESFYRRWLNIAAFDELARDDSGFDLSVAQALSASLLLSATKLYASASPNISSLLSGESYYMNDALRKFYGLPGTGTDFSPVAESNEGRHGVLTHPALLALLARPNQSNPISRGLFIVRNLLCKDVPPPPTGLAIPPLADVTPGLTTRDRLQQHASGAVCNACHQVFDPPGFALENYDEVGRYRTLDQGKAVDSSGTMRVGVDVDGDFATGDQLMANLSTSNDVRTCFAQHYLEFALAREAMAAEDACSAQAIGKTFVSSGDLKQLVASVAQSDAFRLRLAEGVGK